MPDCRPCPRCGYKMEKHKFPPKTASRARAAQGLIWFMEHLHGKPMKKIAREYGVDVATVTKYVKQTADSIQEAGKDKIMQDIFPLAIEVYKARLQFELNEAREGRKPDEQVADRIFKGMFLMDHEPFQPKPQLQEGEEQVETLTGLMVQRQKRLKRDEQKLQLPTGGEIVDGEST